MDVPLSRSHGAITTSALLEQLHEEFIHSPHGHKAVAIDSSSYVVVDSRAIPNDILETVWHHAVRQSEDELLFLMPAHEAAPSLLGAALEKVPTGLDPSVSMAWQVLEPFLTAMTPVNLHQRFHNGVKVQFNINSDGMVVASRLALSEQPLVNLHPLLSLTPEAGYRSFDVFYHLLYSQERRHNLLALKSHPSKYDLLKRSQTFTLPEWVTFADDLALAKDWADLTSRCFSKAFRRAVMATLSGILLLGNSSSPDDLAEGAALIGLDPELAAQYPSHELAAASYVALLQAVVAELNDKFLSKFDVKSDSIQNGELTAVVTLVEGTPQMKYEILRNQFDNTVGINAEMSIQDGIPLPKTPALVNRALKKLANPPPLHQLTVLTNFAAIVDESASWARRPIISTDLDLSKLMPNNRIWTLIIAASADNARQAEEGVWSSVVVSEQLRNFFITEWAQRKAKVGDFTADYGIGEIASRLGGNTSVEQWAQPYDPADLIRGTNRIYLSERVWREFEGIPGFNDNALSQFGDMNPFAPQNRQFAGIHNQPSFHPSFAPHPALGSVMETPLTAPAAPHPIDYSKFQNIQERQVSADLGSDRDGYNEDDGSEYDETEYLKPFKGDVEHDGKLLEVEKQTSERKLWVGFVWMLTWWIPSPILRWFGGMRRRDVRMAWREKIVIFFLIFLLNCGIIFYMIILGRLICPTFDKVWNHKQLATHQGTNDFYVAIHGNVYDITKFYKTQHSDNGIKTSAANMMPFAGLDMSDYFPRPLTTACPSLVSDDTVVLNYNTTLSPYTNAIHSSGPYSQPRNTTKLHDINWYTHVFEPFIQQYHKGSIVETPKHINKLANSEGRYLFILNKKIYDVTNYFITQSIYPSDADSTYKRYAFFPQAVQQMFINYQGLDISKQWQSLDEKTRANSLECLNNAFYYGEIDFRNSAKCQTANIILLVIAGILTFITVVKFLASLSFGRKPLPESQDRFVICQVPVYTEDEDELRLAIDSLANLKYDNRRKLMVILCDGMITGAGNDRPTPEIVLDILGVDDSRQDPEPKAYHAIAEGSRELNRAKVYSGLYENEGNMVPFVVIVKVGGPTEEQRKGNRGKRDSQIILMNFLNRVHHQAPMCPLDLELFHHINNLIGVDPERYDFLLTIDADTKVAPDSLTRLVAACTADKNIAAICGETSIENEQQSISTMVQVYEYFISHHLTKAFESIFGSVTCLPGCFTLYRIRTAQRSKPLFISDDVIRDYSVRHVDTLHKKNLFSLGEDRYLTTLMAKNFPHLKLKFIADAKCKTVVPSDFSVLLSQRRRWINSTVHNLAELLRLETMCGFFVFGMRGVVFVDLIGTLMLPSVVVYLVYLIYVIASHTSPLPLISIVLIGAVYGLQAAVFILHRQWQHVFWMLVYVAAYPFHSFILPIYSFWNMDNFSWGNTRIVVEESKGRMVVRQDENDIYDPRTVPFESWHQYAVRKGLKGAQRAITFDSRRGRIVQEIDEGPFADLNRDWYDETADARTLNLEARHHSYSPSTTSGNRFSAYSLGAVGAGPSTTSGPFDAGTEAQIRSTIQQVLNTTDLDTMTQESLRAKVADLLGFDSFGERVSTVDDMIDEELEKLE